MKSLFLGLVLLLSLLSRQAAGQGSIAPARTKTDVVPTLKAMLTDYRPVDSGGSPRYNLRDP